MLVRSLVPVMRFAEPPLTPLPRRSLDFLRLSRLLLPRQRSIIAITVAVAAAVAVLAALSHLQTLAIAASFLLRVHPSSLRRLRLITLSPAWTV
jgi:hypothetical protein